MIAEALANKRVAITGATGFLGTALVERLLRCVPHCEVVVIVRPGRRQNAAERTAREIIRNDCFDRLRGELGGDFDTTVSRRLATVAGDVTIDGLGLDEAGKVVLASCDIVVHAAASVSFDAPLDSAIEVNLLGPSRVAATMTDLITSHRPAGSPPPHLISVSTAYVSSGHRGDALEEPISQSPYIALPDWRAEVEAARRARSDAHAESRTPRQLAKFRKAARGELGAAGTALLAERTERLREEWVTDRLVELGRARAQSLGWPDAYAYTKSLGEVALADTRGELPVTVIRPSIVESSLTDPVPGWIRGFRMAEPVIISYARGLLRQFPGVPEGIVDVIPVDLVAGAIIAVAARGPGSPEQSVFQIASGVRNPLRYGTLVSLCEAWFTEHPLYDTHGQPIVVPKWSFPGRGKVQGDLRRTSAALHLAERFVNHLPIRGDLAERALGVEEKRLLAERALGYVELYGSYAETEARFRIDRTLGLYDSLDASDQRTFCFDPAVFDWSSYVRDVHLPSVVAHARVRTAPGKRLPEQRDERSRRRILTPEPRCAAFDLEQTLINSNVVESYGWLATRHLAPLRRMQVAAELLLAGPHLLAIDRRDRGDFLRSFYRRYEGAPVDRVRDDSWELFSDLLLTRAFPGAIERVRAHRALGHPTLLITGALDFVIAPLRPLFDEIVCASLGEKNGRFTGELVSTPPTGEARAIMLGEWAASHGLDLERTVAYADSTSDLPMLDAAGLPVVVNPEPKLAAIARRRGWPIEEWERAPGGPWVPLAIAMRRTGPRSPAPRALGPSAPPDGKGARR
ncbi:MAG TPA: HAD-IB family hydrolase [Acidimicrobiales bacterium]|nr:HAD-IB family hydrolase [Acidimicrobiales bacterium]